MNQLLKHLDEFHKGNTKYFNYEDRNQFVRKYGWAVPNQEALNFIKNLNTPLIELCAGKGYWASLLVKMNVDIICYDKTPPPNEYCSRGTYCPINRGDVRVIKQNPGRTLFLVWPPYDNDLEPNNVMGQCLNIYEGQYIIYVGERDGCTSWDCRLAIDWEDVNCVPLPQWNGIHDNLYLFKRKHSTMMAVK